MSEPKDIFEHLRRIRQDQKCSQDALSALTGINSRQYVTRLESGKVNPRIETVVKWADVLGYDIVLKAKQ